jgi:Peptidase A4 family
MSTRQHRPIVTAVAVAAAALALSAAIVSSGPGSSVAATSSRSTSAAFQAAARATLSRYVSHLSAPMRAAGVKNPTATGSYNWSGYADTDSTTGSFTKVSGSWVIPKVACTTEDRILSAWVGLDGFSSSTVEQDGTLSWCYRDVALYYTWYEMYPAGTIVVGNSAHAGDHITASVTRTGTSYAIKLTDSTTSGQNLSVTKTCAASTCLDTSAEWIAERSEYATTGYLPLVPYGTLKFTGGSVKRGSTSGTINSFTPYDITMIDSTQAYDLSTVSGLSSGDTAFTATWKDSY